MNLFVVESPLQLLCAYEAIKIEEQSDYFLLIRQTGRGSNDKHLLTCVEKLGLNYHLIIVRTDKVVFDLLKNMFFLINILSRSYNKTYFGSYYSSFLKLISKFSQQNEIFYLDDGAATLRAQNEIKSKNLAVNWFTFFNLNPIDGQKIYKHNFGSLKDILENKEKGLNYFIGQPYGKMINFSKEIYLSCLKEISKDYSKESPLIYIPHRVEDISILKEVENIHILYLDTPVEMFFVLDSEYKPKRIYSCYSTALFSLKGIFPCAQIIAVKPKVYLGVIEEVYLNMEDLDIKVMEMVV